MEKSYQKHLTVEEELDYIQDQINQLRAYLDKINPEELTDRIHWRATKTGQVPLLTASIESQVKSKLDSIEKLMKMTDRLDEIRNKYAEKQFRTRGDIEIKNSGLDFAKKFNKIDE